MIKVLYFRYGFRVRFGKFFLWMDDHHFFYIFLWMITTFSTSFYGWSPLFLQLSMDDHHLPYKWEWLIHQVLLCIALHYGLQHYGFASLMEHSLKHLATFFPAKMCLSRKEVFFVYQLPCNNSSSSSSHPLMISFSHHYYYYY